MSYRYPDITVIEHPFGTRKRVIGLCLCCYGKKHGQQSRHRKIAEEGECCRDRVSMVIL